jgi:Ca-activated chloride channel family protein
MRILPAVLTALALSGTTPARACDLALVLAVDVSGSVDAREYRIQMDGLAEALRDGVVSEALVRGEAELLLLQWTGSSRQDITLPWTRVDSFAALDAFADRTANAPRVWRNYSTAIGDMLDFVLPAFHEVGHCKRRLIDLSGDGPSNEGLSPNSVHNQLRQAGITVNAIAIEASEPDLTAYFFENVIIGDGAFVETAATFDDYPARIRRKLLREVTRQSASLTD